MVNQSYAAATIEKMLIKKSNGGQDTVLTDKNMDEAMLRNLLQNLCELLTQRKDFHTMKALLRVIQLSK
jgi:hypothetical protein